MMIRHAIRSLYRAVKINISDLTIRPVFSSAEIEKKDFFKFTTEPGRLKLLVVHPGYSCQRHYNNLEAVIELLKRDFCEQHLELYVLACDGAVNACGFYMFYPAQVKAKIKVPHSACVRCSKNHRRRIGNKSYHYVSLARLLDEDIMSELRERLRSLETQQSYETLRNYEVAGVRIGHLVIESIQRSLLETTHECYDLSVGTIAYEYFRSAVIYALVSDKLFRDGNYDLTIGNEVSYIDWGIPALFSLKHQTPYVHQVHHYPGLKHLLLAKHENASSLSWPPYVPTPNLIGEICENPELKKKYKEIGKKKLASFMGEASKIDVLENLAAELGPKFDSSRRNIFVYTHLCWDGAQSFGDPVFESFELWLLDILHVARKRTDLNWILKIHPAEDDFEVSKNRNTRSFLEEHISGVASQNIFIMHANSTLHTRDLVPLMLAGTTVNGTVTLELAAHGIPCLVASRVGYADFPFVHRPRDKADYQQKILTIDTLSPPLSEDRELAEVVFGVAFSNDSYISVEGLFEKSDASDRFVSRDTLRSWLGNTRLKFGLVPTESQKEPPVLRVGRFGG